MIRLGDPAHGRVISTVNKTVQRVAASRGCRVGESRSGGCRGGGGRGSGGCGVGGLVGAGGGQCGFMGWVPRCHLIDLLPKFGCFIIYFNE